MVAETGYLVLACAVVFSAAVSVLDRYVLRDGKNLGTYGFLTSLGHATVGVIIWLAVSGLTSSTPNGWWYAFIGAVVTSGFVIIWLKTAQAIDASLMSFFFLIGVAFSLAMATLLLGEPFTFWRAAAFALILTGSLIASSKEKKPDWSNWKKSGLVLLVFAAFLGALNGFVDKQAVSGFDVFAYSAFTGILSTIALAVFIPQSVSGVPAYVKNNRKNLLWVALRVLLGIGGYYGILFAYKQVPFGVVMLVMQTMIPLIFLGGVLLLGERQNLKVRAIGAAIALAGGIIAALYA